MKLSKKQINIANRALNLIANGEKEVSIAGLAGTGKTTVANYVITKLNEDKKISLTLCPTGKAADVIRRKGQNATTIHSAIYNFGGKYTNDKDKEYLVWHDKDGLVIHPYLIIVDEASMVNEKIADDLRDFDFPILWIGDHGQLPPIGRDPQIMSDPDFTLTEIFRQDENSGIINFAHAVRYGNDLMSNGNVKTLNCIDFEDTLSQRFDQVICGFNKTRISYNTHHRNLSGHTGVLNPGERIICLFNNRFQSIYNGTQLKVLEVHGLKDSFVKATIQIEGTDVTRTLDILIDSFNGQKYNEKLLNKSAIACDYAYAITCHKSQGSEWGNVLVINQSCHAWDQARWLYTAATRASKQLTVSNFIKWPSKVEVWV